MTSTLPRWLAGRTSEDLAEILGRRAETLSPPVPRDLGDVASRLQAPGHIMAVLCDLPRPCLELLETLLVLGPVSTTRLAAIIGVDVDDPTFDAALRVCELWVLAWEYQDMWYVSGALRTLLPTPLHLGPPVAELLTPRTVDDLRARAAAIGVTAGKRKVDIVDALVAFYADGDSVRKLYQAAPSAQRELLLEAAWRHPVLRYEGAYLYTGRPDPAISWLLTHSLAVADWQQIVVPREVALAIRGDDWRPPLHRRPELATLVDVAIEDADRDAAAAAGAAVKHVAALLDAAGTTSITLLKAGGVGVKEIRRLAKATGIVEPAVRLWLEVAYEAGLCDVVDAGDRAELLPSAGYDDWLASDPADRLIAIVNAWHELNTVPLIEARPGVPARGVPARGVPARAVPARAVLADDPYGAVAAQLRADVLAVAAEAGRGIASLDEVVAVVAWRRPLICAALGDGTRRDVAHGYLAYGHPAHGHPAHGHPAHGHPAHGSVGHGYVAPGYSAAGDPAAGDFADIAAGDLARAIGPIWAEAHMLGLLGRGALSSLGRALVDDRTRAGGQLAEVAPRFVPAAASEAIFQADLTIVVAGSPSAQVSALLDAVADRESRGAATTWRCSPSSVRRALDAGHTVEDLLPALRRIATGAGLPQPLEYLITDLARRHGELRVRSVGCVLRCDDQALLTEIAATKSLASLRLAMIAPTVLVSAAGTTATLAALRSAGYAPVGEGDDGMPVIERAPRRRSPTHLPDQRLSWVPATAPADPSELAMALLATPLNKTPSPPHLVLVGAPPQANRGGGRRSSTMDQLIRYAGQLDATELRLLADSIDEGHPVRIRYTSAAGASSTRVIEPIELDGDALVAWCQLRDDERNFRLGRIAEVNPD